MQFPIEAKSFAT